MTKKSFTETQKPARPPSPEEIAAFEDTGRAARHETQVSAKAETQKHVEHEVSEPGITEITGALNTPSQKDGNAEGQVHGNAETQSAEPKVRLTIDLPESTHTRFKAACAITRRKMVEEVRHFIERRTTELERDSGGTESMGQRRVTETNQHQ